MEKLVYVNEEKEEKSFKERFYSFLDSFYSSRFDPQTMFEIEQGLTGFAQELVWGGKVIVEERSREIFLLDEELDINIVLPILPYTMQRRGEFLVHNGRKPIGYVRYGRKPIPFINTFGSVKVGYETDFWEVPKIDSVTFTVVENNEEKNNGE